MEQEKNTGSNNQMGDGLYHYSYKEEFIHHARTRFYADNFVEDIDFDYLDFHVIEED